MDTISKIKSIDEKVNKILEVCKADTLPINVKKICKHFNIRYSSTDLSELEKTAKWKISGILMIKDKEKIIFTNCNEAATRQRFTIAHELGHFFEDKEKPEISISFRGLYNEEERQADEFAANLLMPFDMVSKEYNKALYPSVSYLAGIFEVSKPAMRRRLKELRLDYIDL